jgi:hypothetical protein
MKLHAQSTLAVVWLLLTPPNPSHMHCVSTVSKYEGTNVLVAEHVAFGVFQNWQVWGGYSDEKACAHELGNLHKGLDAMPQNLGSENYACFRDIQAEALCVSSDDSRLK